LPRQVWNLEAAAKGDLPNSEAKNNRSGLTGMLFNRRINQHIYFVASAHTFCYFFFFFFSATILSATWLQQGDAIRWSSERTTSNL